MLGIKNDISPPSTDLDKPMPFPRTSSRKGHGILTIKVEYFFKNFVREPFDGRVIPWDPKLALVVCVGRRVYLFGAAHSLFHGDGRWTQCPLHRRTYLRPSVRRYRWNEEL